MKIIEAKIVVCLMEVSTMNRVFLSRLGSGEGGEIFNNSILFKNNSLLFYLRIFMGGQGLNGGEPSRHGGEPSRHGGEPSRHGGEPSRHGGEPLSLLPTGENPDERVQSARKFCEIYINWKYSQVRVQNFGGWQAVSLVFKPPSLPPPRYFR